MQEGVIITPWRTRDLLPTHPTLRTQILWLFKTVEEHSALIVWANASQIWERTRIQQQVTPEHQKQLFTEEQREMLQELNQIPMVVWQFMGRSQQNKQAVMFRAWRDYNRLVKRLSDIPQTATTARASMDRLRELNQMHNEWRWSRRRQEVAFGEWKWTVELMGMARMTADVRFDEFNLQLFEEAFERCGSELRTGYDLRTARRSLNLLFADWANRGINMWTIEQGSIPMVQGVNTYDFPVDTVDL
jgi:hypothetical protein